MTLLLQLSDPHFGTERPAVAVALRALVQARRPQLLLLSGDITQRATAAQFAAARAFVDSLGVSLCLAIPGNHDIPLFDLASRLLRPYERYARAFGTQLEPQFENDDLLLLALNTTRRLRHVDGELSAEQIERVARRFEAARPGQWRVVVVHQPIAVPSPEQDHDLLHGHQAARRRWAAAGADLVVGGHIHLPYVLALSEGSAARPLWAVQAGTALSRRVRAGVGNSVNLIHLHGAADGVARQGRVERWDHLPLEQRFECVAVHPLEPAGGA
jgi:3',5'-cyclic AMP phosphodiesterase CpdA